MNNTEGIVHVIEMSYGICSMLAARTHTHSKPVNGVNCGRMAKAVVDGRQRERQRERERYVFSAVA